MRQTTLYDAGINSIASEPPAIKPRNQYAAAEERIAKLSQQASSIAGILSQMGGANNNSNS
ncbi:MAG: hypothetical protein IJ576_07075 [Synergistaceae bacterium]|nr:hypothetical protein [Synergistaceae bacterium]MBR1418709.1 hypothetical protein [Synergistaceae bacterium]